MDDVHTVEVGDEQLAYFASEVKGKHLPVDWNSGVFRLQSFVLGFRDNTEEIQWFISGVYKVMFFIRNNKNYRSFR